jgi:hypothetical protein
MKRLALTAVCLLLAGHAWAQPQEIESEGLIKLSVGQAKAFEFSEPIGRIDFAPKDIVEGVPQTDRQFTISPLTSGSTRMFVRDPTGKLVYNVDIVVAPEPGQIVKLYGINKNDDLNAGYTAVYCTEFGCERPDKDLPKPTAITVERLSRFKEGALPPR